MATIHIPEAEAAGDFAAVMTHIRAGSEVIIEANEKAVAVKRPAERQPGLLLSEIVARAEARGSTATLDEAFSRDLEDAINSHPEPLTPPEWD